ncbi:hypothetical protein N1851_030613 [Merluccius polli]|uniref:Uncharacterized protein n=1 Tax=Merluccius polli TaxID=89951 RepID=A0AA47M565_MERPO|nr:hypothetical protein N1851_030613 [Merluccius polli]
MDVVQTRYRHHGCGTDPVPTPWMWYRPGTDTMDVVSISWFNAVILDGRSVMGKNKQRVKKQQNVFQVANKQGKNKNKTKPVKTSLKHMNAVKNEKVENLNQIFTEVQREVKSISKSVAPAPQKPMQVVKEAAKEAVNVDSAAQLFSQL